MSKEQSRTFWAERKESHRAVIIMMHSGNCKFRLDKVWIDGGEVEKISLSFSSRLCRQFLTCPCPLMEVGCPPQLFSRGFPDPQVWKIMLSIGFPQISSELLL